MDFAFTEDQQMLRDTVREFAEREIGPRVMEFDESDNTNFRVIESIGLPDLTATAAQLTLQPAFARSGDAISISASVVNAGQQESAPSQIEVRLDDPSTGTILLSESVGTLSPGESATFTAIWDSTGTTGEHELFLILDVNGDVREQREDNNLVRRSLALQDADAFFGRQFLE